MRVKRERLEANQRRLDKKRQVADVEGPCNARPAKEMSLARRARKVRAVDDLDRRPPDRGDFVGLVRMLYDHGAKDRDIGRITVMVSRGRMGRWPESRHAYVCPAALVRMRILAAMMLAAMMVVAMVTLACVNVRAKIMPLCLVPSVGMSQHCWLRQQEAGQQE